MLKHHLVLFLRNIKRTKGTFITMTLGLAVGISSFLILSLYVYNDLTYNQFHDNLANIYRIREGEGIQTKGPLLPKILEEIPEVEDGTRIFDWDGQRLSYKNVAFFENIHYVDEGFFSIFSFPFSEEAVANPIKEKYGAVISKQTARKYFGDEPAIGKQLRVNFGDVFLTVNGVVDIPANSSIKFDIIASYETGQEILPYLEEIHDWYNTFSISYVLLKEGVQPNDLSTKLGRIVKENFLPVGENETQLNLLPFKDYHSEVESNQNLIIILTIIALGILGIALVNFINLSITATISRTREMGIKKVHGATGSHFLRQIITESLLTSLGALLLGIFLTTTLLPFFNRLFETSLHFDLRGTPYLSLILIAIWGGIGLISGLVPSTFWARGRLVQNLQGKFFTGMKMGVFRYSSIILQFVIALVLISGTLLIRKQINYMTEMDPKFDRENVVTAETGYWQFKDAQKVTRNLAVIARELERSPNVESVSFSQNVPGLYHENFNIFYPEGKSETEVLYLRKAYVGEDYFKTFGIPVLSGDGFDKGTASKDRTAVINKTALNALGMENAGGQVLREGSETGEPYRIIGVIDDFSYQGVQNAIQPLAHFLVDNETPIEWSYLSVRAIPGASMEVLELLKAKWQEFLPEGKLDYFFADEKLHEYYKEYEKINTLITWFSMLAIALSCMGLYALSSYTAARRTKEIGIRKVNGATILQIIALLNKDFVRWVALAFIIAVPFSWFAMNKWLEGFAHKTGISWWIFATAGCLALTIALLTISSQSIRAAMSNPAEVLRDE